ncbi:MAG: domain S-box, partial [Chthoniobacter sp.]|nr:domain S-box [Chthoniobacter sp.]
MSESSPNANASFARLDALLRRALIFNHIYDPMVVTGLDGMIVDWNSGAERAFGWRRAEVMGKSLEILHQGARSRSALQALAAAVTGGVRRERFEVSRKDKSKVQCEGVALALLSESGEAMGLLNLYQEAEQAPATPIPSASRPAKEDPSGIVGSLLSDERFLLRTLIDAVPDPIFCKDRQGRFLLHNLADQKMFQSRNADHLGKTVFDVEGLNAHAAAYHQDDVSVIETGSPVINREEPFQRPDGSKGWFLTSKFPLRDQTGEIIGLVGIARDISQMKRATEELQQAQLRLLDHVQNSPLAVIEWDGDFRVTRWAGQAENTFGWRSEEIVGKHFDEFQFIHPEDLEKVRQTAKRLSSGDEQRNLLHNRNLTRGGRVLHCLWQNSVLHDRNGQPTSMLSLVQDVS